MVFKKSMWNYGKICVNCGIGYKGHPASKYCCYCRRKVLKRQADGYRIKALAKKKDGVVSVERQRVSRIVEEVFRMKHLTLLKRLRIIQERIWK